MTRSIKTLLPERPTDASFFAWYVAMTKIFYQRAMTYVNVPVSVLTMLNFVMIAELRLNLHIGDLLGIPQAAVYGLIIVLIPVICITIGYFDFRMKIQQHENILLYEHLSPRGKEMLENSRQWKEVLQVLARIEKNGGGEK